MPNTVAYFDITIAGEPAGRIVFELFDDVVPKVRTESGGQGVLGRAWAVGARPVESGAERA